jgi:general secretion pathway protein C
MARYASWLANAALFALCCFLVANTTNTVLAALAAAPPAEAAEVPASPGAAGHTWQDREVILQRNLFNASLLTPTEAAVDAKLEETKLPLDLVGTVAAADARLSWAAVRDRETSLLLVLRVEDDVKSGRAKVVSIEPRRVVLSENGAMRELSFPEETAPAAPARAARAVPPGPARMLAARRQANPAAGVTPPPADAAQAAGMRQAAKFLSQARIVPKYEDGQMVGMSVSGIQPGSMFEQMGIREGSVITGVNGVPTNSPQDSARFFGELGKGGPIVLEIRDENGTPQTVNYPPPDSEESP